MILDEVAAEMNRIVTLFRKHSRRFSGKISIAAHSLGGVICFDLLANQESVRLHPLAWKKKGLETGREHRCSIDSGGHGTSLAP